MGENRKSRRKPLFPFWQLQSRIVLTICVALILSTTVVSIFQAYFLISVMNPEQRASIANFPLVVGLAELAIFMPLFIIIAAIATRGIVGPLRRLPKELLAVADGNLHTPIRFREGDQIHFVADAASDMKSGLSDTFETCRQSADKIRRLSGELNIAAPDAAQTLAGLRAEANALAEQLAKFKPAE
jgi:methyl-accepting chemotaxis protein